MKRIVTIAVPSLAFSLVLATGGFLAAACGGSDTEVESPATTDVAKADDTGTEAKKEDHHPFTGHVKMFHDALAPLWHAEKGEQRQTDTCAGVDGMMSHVPHLAKMPPEGADADAWTEATDKLTSQLDALKADCEAGAKDFEAKFTAVHEAFHAIVKLTPKGQEHVEGQEGGEEHDHGSHDHGDSD